jgi:hypothetical protein
MNIVFGIDYIVLLVYSSKEMKLSDGTLTKRSGLSLETVKAWRRGEEHGPAAALLDHLEREAQPRRGWGGSMSNEAIKRQDMRPASRAEIRAAVGELELSTAARILGRSSTQALRKALRRTKAEADLTVFTKLDCFKLRSFRYSNVAV